MNTSDQSCYIDLINNFIPNTDKYAGLIIYFLTIISNLICLLIFSTKSWRKNVCAFYLTCYIFFSICFIQVFMLPGIITNIFNKTPQNSNHILCKLFMYTYYLLGTLSPNVLMLASIDRLLISSQNVDTRLYSSKRLAYFSLSISFCCWAIYYIHSFIKSDLQQISSSGVTCDFDHSEPYYSFAYYSLAATNFIGCALTIILCILSFKNVRSIRAVPRQQRAQQIRSMKKKDFQLLRCLYTLDIVYVLFSMLTLTYEIFHHFLLQNSAETLMEKSVYDFLSKLFALLDIIPYSSGFCIFMIMSKAFRHEVKRLCYKMCGT